MASITTTEFLNYYDGNGSSAISSIVGHESNVPRCVRFKFQSPSNGASRVSISGDFSHGGGEKTAIRWYITTSDSSHAAACSEAAYHGTISMNADGGVYKGTGSADVALQPDTTYYLWLFPSDATYGYWVHYGSLTITTSGSTPYKLTIYQGTGSTITVKRNGTLLSNGATINHGDVLNITFGANTGYNLGTHTVNDSSFTSGSNHTVTGAVSAVSTATLKTYKLAITSDDHCSVTVKRTSSGGGSTGNLANGATLYHGDKLTVSFSADSGYKVETSTLNDSPISSGTSHTVTGAVSIIITAASSGVVFIANEPYQAYIGNGTGWELYVANIGSGTDWDMCG